MKTPEEISESYWYARGITLDKGVIQLIQNDAYNQALEDVIAIKYDKIRDTGRIVFSYVIVEDIEKLKK